jgi:hypothetical protein
MSQYEKTFCAKIIVFGRDWVCKVKRCPYLAFLTPVAHRLDDNSGTWIFGTEIGFGANFQNGKPV